MEVNYYGLDGASAVEETGVPTCAILTPGAYAPFGRQPSPSLGPAKCCVCYSSITRMCSVPNCTMSPSLMPCSAVKQSAA